MQVNPNSPAGKAGLQPFTRGRDGSVVPGDIIVAINDEPVASLDDMLTLLEKRQPGDQVTLSVSRGGRGRKVPVVLGAPD